MIGVGIGSCNYNRRHFLYRGALAGSSFVEITLPLRWILNRVTRESSSLAGSRFIAKLNQVVDAGVIRNRKPFHVDADFHVRQQQRMLFVLRDHDINRSRQDAAERIQFRDISWGKM